MDKDKIIATIFRIISYTAFLIILLLFTVVIADGLKSFSPAFFSQYPQDSMTKGGIFPAILGSLAILLVSLAIAIPIGVLTGVFLSEYAGSNWFSRVIDTAITSLSGVPSVVFGLFGLSIFCISFGFKNSILSGSMTLAIMTLPVISSAVREALQSVPKALRESGYALGTKKSEVVFKIVLKHARSRIITAILIGGGRVIGETAPVLLTGAVFYATSLPKSIMEPVMTLPTHIYYLTMSYSDSAVWMTKGTAAFLMILILVLYTFAFRIRRKLNER